MVNETVIGLRSAWKDGYFELPSDDVPGEVECGDFYEVYTRNMWLLKGETTNESKIKKARQFNRLLLDFLIELGWDDHDDVDESPL